MKIWGSIPGSGGGGQITLETNGVPNGSQVLLNLAQAGIITLTDDGAGKITINAPAPVYPVTSVAGKVGAVVLVEGDIANLVTDLAAKSPLASPVFTGTPSAPTPAIGDNSTKLATTAFVAAVGCGLSVENDVSATRVFGTIYQNTLSRPIFVSIRGTKTTAGTVRLNIDSVNPPFVTVSEFTVANAALATVSGWVMPGYYYQLSANTGGFTIARWIEWS